MARALHIATSILLVKDRIQQYYVQQAQLEASLNTYKRKHGYCSGRPFCMHPVKDDEITRKDCKHANANPQYKKKQSDYGRMRAKERADEREKKEKSKPRKKQERKKAA